MSRRGPDPPRQAGRRKRPGPTDRDLYALADSVEAFLRSLHREGERAAAGSA